VSGDNRQPAVRLDGDYASCRRGSKSYADTIPDWFTDSDADTNTDTFGMSGEQSDYLFDSQIAEWTWHQLGRTVYRSQLDDRADLQRHPEWGNSA